MYAIFWLHFRNLFGSASVGFSTLYIVHEIIVFQIHFQGCIDDRSTLSYVPCRKNQCEHPN